MLLALTASQLTKLVQEEKFLEPGILPNPQASRNSTRRLGFFPPPGPSLSLYTSTLDSISSRFYLSPISSPLCSYLFFCGGNCHPQFGYLVPGGREAFSLPTLFNLGESSITDAPFTRLKTALLTARFSHQSEKLVGKGWARRA